jgi:hypothetical protein
MWLTCSPHHELTHIDVSNLSLKGNEQLIASSGHYSMDAPPPAYIQPFPETWFVFGHFVLPGLARTPSQDVEGRPDGWIEFSTMAGLVLGWWAVK